MNKYLNVLGDRNKLCNIGNSHEIEFSPKNVTNIYSLITYSPPLHTLERPGATAFTALY